MRKVKKEADLRQLSIDVMDIVSEVAGRRLVQILEQVFEESILPLHREIARLKAELELLRGKRNDDGPAASLITGRTEGQPGEG